MYRPPLRGLVLVALSILMPALAGCEQPPWAQSRTFLFGGRLPRSYFLAKASAQSDDEPEAGLRDAARVAAGLGAVNVVPGVLSLPVEAEEIHPPESLPPGAMLDAAVAELSGPKGRRLTAAVRIAQVRDTKTGGNLGGLIVTYRGDAEPAQAVAQLDRALQRAFERRYSKDDCELVSPKTVVESLTPEKKLGTVLVAIVFTNVIHPQVGGPEEWKSLREIVSE